MIVFDERSGLLIIRMQTHFQRFVIVIETNVPAGLLHLTSPDHDPIEQDLLVCALLTPTYARSAVRGKVPSDHLAVTCGQPAAE